MSFLTNFKDKIINWLSSFGEKTTPYPEQHVVEVVVEQIVTTPVTTEKPVTKKRATRKPRKQKKTDTNAS